MPRGISDRLRRAIFASESRSAVVFLLTIDHPTLSAPITVTDNAEDVISQGVRYLQCPFSITLPNDTDEVVKSLRLVIDNTTREVVRAVRTLIGQEPPSITLRVVDARVPDTVEVEITGIKLRNVTYDAAQVEGDLSASPDILNEPYPADDMTPNTVPGVF